MDETPIVPPAGVPPGNTGYGAADAGPVRTGRRQSMLVEGALKGRDMVVIGVNKGRQQFRQRPYQTSVVILTAFVVLLSFCAMFVPWLRSSFNYKDGDATDEVDLELTLFERTRCIEEVYTGDSKLTPSKYEACSVVRYVNDIEKLNYLYGAGASAFTFCLIGFFVSIMTMVVVVHMRNGTLDSLHPHAKVFCGRKGNRDVVLFYLLLSALLYMLAFSCWTGVVNNNINETEFKAYVAGSTGVDAKDFGWWHADGVALSIINFLLSLISAYLVFIKFDEQDKDLGNQDTFNPLPDPGVAAANDFGGPSFVGSSETAAPAAPAPAAPNAFADVM